jgi:hypothetical protein
MLGSWSNVGAARSTAREGRGPHQPKLSIFWFFNQSDLSKETPMNKSQKQHRKKIVPIREKDLRSAQGGAHVDNPGQTPMDDGTTSGALLAFPFIQQAMQGS